MYVKQLEWSFLENTQLIVGYSCAEKVPEVPFVHLWLFLHIRLADRSGSSLLCKQIMFLNTSVADRDLPGCRNPGYCLGNPW